MKNLERTALSPRLLSLAAMVRQGARLIDVGTDHAYLPVFLAQSGSIQAALATDIADGPILRARAHIRQAGVERTVQTLKTSGLNGTAFFGATDVVVAGMGGELIASIIDGAPYLKERKIRLILQPMTKQAHLRSQLSANGFEIVEETLVEEDKRIYQALCATYTGKTCHLSPLEALVGKRNLEKGGEILEKMLSVKKRQLRSAADGIRTGGGDAAREEELIMDIENYLFRREGRTAGTEETEKTEGTEEI